jgi:hypothetical protein
MRWDYLLLLSILKLPMAQRRLLVPEQIKQIVSDSEILGSSNITSLTDVTPLKENKNGVNSYLVGSDSGLDYIVSSRTGQPTSLAYNRSAYFLRGLLTETETSYVGKHGVFRIAAFTGVDGFNTVMEQLGRIPGQDCFKQVSSPFGITPRDLYCKAATIGQIWASSAEEYYAVHDRALAAHRPTLWSTPAPFFEEIKSAATSAVETANPDAQLAVTLAIDQLISFVNCFIPDLYSLITKSRVTRLSVTEHLANAQHVVRSYGDSLLQVHPGRLEQIAIVLARLSCAAATTQPDLSRGMPWPRDSYGNILRTSKPARQTANAINKLAVSYALNNLDIFKTADELMGPPKNADPKRRLEFTTRLIESLAA